MQLKYRSFIEQLTAFQSACRSPKLATDLVSCLAAYRRLGFWRCYGSLSHNITYVHRSRQQLCKVGTRNWRLKLLKPVSRSDCVYCVKHVIDWHHSVWQWYFSFRIKYSFRFHSSWKLQFLFIFQFSNKFSFSFYLRVRIIFVSVSVSWNITVVYVRSCLQNATLPSDCMRNFRFQAEHLIDNSRFTYKLQMSISGP